MYQATNFGSSVFWNHKLRSIAKWGKAYLFVSIEL